MSRKRRPVEYKVTVVYTATSEEAEVTMEGVRRILRPVLKQMAEAEIATERQNQRFPMALVDKSQSY